MAILFDKSNVIGHCVVELDHLPEPITVNIYGGNCTAVFVYSHDGVDYLFWFFSSSEHIRNIYKAEKNVFPFEVHEMVVNYNHPSAPILVKYFTKSFISVLCI